jgi:hypothetical protein
VSGLEILILLVKTLKGDFGDSDSVHQELAVLPSKVLASDQRGS